MNGVLVYRFNDYQVAKFLYTFYSMPLHVARKQAAKIAHGERLQLPTGAVLIFSFDHFEYLV